MKETTYFPKNKSNYLKKKANTPKHTEFNSLYRNPKSTSPIAINLTICFSFEVAFRF